MIVTLVAQTKRFQEGLSDAGKRAQLFGGIVGGAMNMALGAIGLLAGAIFLFLPNLIKMGEDARKSELRLGNVAKQMGLFGDETDMVTRRISKYAETMSFATGVDDELIRGAEAILLTFGELAKTAGTTGGAFDRATKAAVDLAAAGFGEIDSNAVQLGKALQDPIQGITALSRSGVTFTDSQKELIKSLVDSNRLLEAQDLVLSAIETQVGGTAEAIASNTDKMSARFESLFEELSLSLLPAVDEISQAMIDWLDSVEGKEAIKKLTDELIAFGDWITSPDGKKAVDELVGSLKILADTLSAITGFLTAAADAFQKFNAQAKYYGDIDSGLPFIPDLPAPRLGTTSTRGAIPGPNTTNINIQGITPAATIARTVKQSLNIVGRYGR
jgi:hypothetical protein